MYGDVGCGKTFLMDMFYEGAPVPKKRRVHFNAFMLEVHSKIHKWREGKRRALEKKYEEDREGPDLPNFNLGVSASLGEEEWGDPIPPLARELAAQAPLLCFDEFQVTDVADAMILHRLFSLMFTHGLTVVVTSNRPPDDLYKGGLQRDRFLPFIDLIKRRCLVHDFGSGRDYRLRGNQNINIYQVEKPGVDVANNLETLFGELTHHVPAKSINISVGGRKLFVPRAERGVAFFSFSDLCKQALGAADYIAISQEFHTVIVSRIPKMEDRHREEAKRFITLIDELYNHKVKMICSAAAEPRQLFAGGVEKREWFDESTGKSVGTIWQGEEERFMFNRTVSRLIEMQSDDYLQSPHKKESTMSTQVKVSAVVNAPVENVWKELRDFTFPARLISTVESAELLDGAQGTAVGGARKLKWKSGESATQVLLELSDIERRAVWETTLAEPDTEVAATISTLHALRITENNSTLLTWSAEFSADVTPDFIKFQHKALQDNLAEIKAHFAH